MEWSIIVLLIASLLTIVNGGEIPTLSKPPKDSSQVTAGPPPHLQYGGEDLYGRPAVLQQVQLPQQTTVYGEQQPLIPGEMSAYVNSNISTSQMMTQQLNMPTGIPTTGMSIGGQFGLTPTVPQSTISIGAQFGLTPTVSQSTISGAASNPTAAYHPATSNNPNTQFVQNASLPESFGRVYPPPIQTHSYNNDTAYNQQLRRYR